MWQSLSFHTKIVLTITAILLVVGTISFLGFENSNMQTMLSDNFGAKLLKAAFQSTTLRTAGFSTISQTELTTVSKFTSICYMFVGGSPASTAGGIKTTTLAVIILCIMSFISGKKEVTLFEKTISVEVIRRAIVIFAISIFIIIVAVMVLLISEVSHTEELLSERLSEFAKFSFIEILFEVVSAFGTVGLTLGITTKLSVIGKLIISILMLIGRLGPITISLAVFKRDKEENQNLISYPNGKILVG